MPRGLFGCRDLLELRGLRGLRGLWLHDLLRLHGLRGLRDPWLHDLLGPPELLQERLMLPGLFSL